MQQAKRITGNFTKIYEISRREAQRFYYENWKMMKIHLRNHSINRNPFSVLMREHYIENMERIMMNSVNLKTRGPIIYFCDGRCPS